MFDPHATHLPHVNPANPGKLLDLAAGGPGAELVRRHPPLFEPVRAFGFDPFRLPAAARRRRRRAARRSITRLQLSL
jgi:hypothetical protein